MEKNKFINKFCPSCQWFHDVRHMAGKMKEAAHQKDDDEQTCNAINPFSSCKADEKRPVFMFLFEKLLSEFEPPSACPYHLEYIIDEK